MRQICTLIGLLLLFALGVFTNSYAQYTTSNNANDLAQQVVGDAIQLQNVTLMCGDDAAGIYDGEVPDVNITDAILLTTGLGEASFDQNQGGLFDGGNAVVLDSDGDPTLDALLTGGQQTQDACVLEFDMTLLCDTFKVNYVFLSEEYPEYVCTPFNDIFGFFISGTNPAGGNYDEENIALIPGTNTPVAINTVNIGQAGDQIGADPANCGNGGLNNTQYYVNNTPGDNIEYDGFTTPLTAIAAVVPCEQYHVKLAIADVNDGQWDSGVFIEKLFTNCDPLNIRVNVVDSIAIEDCDHAAIDIIRFDGNINTDPMTVDLSISGTTTNGTDHNTIPTQITFNPGEDSIRLDIQAILDGIPEGVETLTIDFEFTGGCAGGGASYSATIYIYDELEVSLPDDFNSCSIDTTLNAHITGGIPDDYTITWLLDNVEIPDENDTTLNITQSGTYTINVQSGNLCEASDDIVIGIGSAAVSIVPQTGSLCLGDSIELTTDPTNDISSWSWTPANNMQDPSASSTWYTPTTADSVEVVVTFNSGCVASDKIFIDVIGLDSLELDDVTVCEGTTAQLDGPAGFDTYTWSPNINLDNPNIEDPTVDPAIDTVYILTVSNASGCSTAGTLRLSTISLDSIELQDVSICDGQSAQIDGPAGFDTYVWAPADDFVDATVEDPTVNPDSTSTYTLTASTSDGCTTHGEVTVNVIKTDSLALDDLSICEGDSSQLNGPGGFDVYEWTPTNTLNNASIEDPIAFPTVTTTYTLNVTSDAGCSASGSLELVVNGRPDVTLSAQPTEVCLGEQVQLTLNGADNYWWLPLGNVATNTTITPDNSTKLVVVGEDANGCLDTAEISITVHPLPTINLTPDPGLCIGASTTLEANGAQNYTWSPDSIITTNNNNNVIISPNVSQTVQVIGEDVNGCLDTATTFVTVHPLPIPLVPNDTTICSGSSIVLNASGGVSFNWNPGGTTNPITVSPTSNTRYEVTVTDANGCEDTASVTVNVGNPPNTTISPDVAICPGDTTTLTVTGGSSYLWTPGNDTSSSITVSPLSTTVYQVTIGSDLEGCSVIETVTVSIRDLPVALITGDLRLCEGETATLTASGGNSYLWQDGPGLISTTGATVNFVPPIGTNTYAVEVNDQFGCSSSTTHELEVIPGVVPDISIGVPAKVCDGDNVSIPITDLSNQGNSPGFQWQTSLNGTDFSNYSSFNNNNPLIVNQPEDSTYVRVILTSNADCANPDTSHSNLVLIRTEPYPLPVLDGPFHICPDSNATITLDVTNNEEAPIITWYYAPENSDEFQALDNNNTYELTTEDQGQYQVHVTNTTGCESWSNISTIFKHPVYVIANADPIIIEENETSTLTVDTDGSFISWQNEEDSLIYTGTVSNIVVNPKQTSTYYVTALNDYNCEAYADITIIVLPPVTIPNVFTPNDDGVNDTWHIANIEAYPEAELKIRNRYGNIVYKTDNVKNDAWNGQNGRDNHIPVGTYYFELRLNFKEKVYSGDVTVLR